MTNEELDKCAAEKFGITSLTFSKTVSVEPGEMISISVPKNPVWNPTHPDSNQAERYLFPNDPNFVYEMELQTDYFEITIWIMDENADKHLWCSSECEESTGVPL